jgi:hypothetical protein
MRRPVTLAGDHGHVAFVTQSTASIEVRTTTNLIAHAF